MTEQTDPPLQYYCLLPLEVELWLLIGLNNLNQDNSLDALGWPWFDVRDMQILMNRVYMAKLIVYGIDCGILKQGNLEYVWTINWEDFADPSPDHHYAANWFFIPFEERIQQLVQDQLLDKVVFSCTLARNTPG